MKKTFQLKSPGKIDARVVEAVKNDVRKYVKRERRKPLPEGFTEWEFRCTAGPNAELATECKLGEITAAIDHAAGAGSSEIYLEIVAEPGHRTPRRLVDSERPMP